MTHPTGSAIRRYSSSTSAAFVVCFLVAVGCTLVEEQKAVFFGCYQRDRSGQLGFITDRLHNCVDQCGLNFYRYAALSDTQCACFNTIRSRQIGDKECNLRCQQNEDLSCGGDYAQSFYETGVEAASPVKNLKLVDKEKESTIKVSWEHPSLDGIPVDEYEINANSISTYANYRLYPMSWSVHNNSHFELSSLVPGTKYNITVTSVSEKGPGGMRWLVAQTEIGVPDPEPEEPVILRRLDSTIQIQIQKAINNNGPINYYRVVVHYVNNDLVQQFVRHPPHRERAARAVALEI